MVKRSKKLSQMFFPKLFINGKKAMEYADAHSMSILEIPCMTSGSRRIFIVGWIEKETVLWYKSSFQKTWRHGQPLIQFLESNPPTDKRA